MHSTVPDCLHPGQPTFLRMQIPRQLTHGMRTFALSPFWDQPSPLQTGHLMSVFFLPWQTWQSTLPALQLPQAVAALTPSASILR